MNNALKLFASSLLVAMLCYNSQSTNAMQYNNNTYQSNNYNMNSNNYSDKNNSLNKALISFAMQWNSNRPRFTVYNEQYSKLKAAIENLIQPYYGISPIKIWGHENEYYVDYFQNTQIYNYMKQLVNDALLALQDAQSIILSKDYDMLNTSLQKIKNLIL